MVIVKLHFDYEAVATRQNYEPKPSSHLQMCGKPSPGLLHDGFNSQRLSAHYPEFEKPRLPVMPTSLAILIDWLFTEFKSDRMSQAIHVNGQWKNQVIAAEKTVLKPYFEAAAAHIGSAAHDTRPLIRQMLYET